MVFFFPEISQLTGREKIGIVFLDGETVRSLLHLHPSAASPMGRLYEIMTLERS